MQIERVPLAILKAVVNNITVKKKKENHQSVIYQTIIELDFRALTNESTHHLQNAIVAQPCLIIAYSLLLCYFVILIGI